MQKWNTTDTAFTLSSEFRIGPGPLKKEVAKRWILPSCVGSVANGAILLRMYSESPGIFYWAKFINRPGVAGVVLQSPPSIINWFIQSSFSSMFIPNYVSHVTCHLSPVKCHLSHVTCQMSKKSYPLKNGQSGVASWWRVCYQRGLPRLVYLSPIYLVVWVYRMFS